MGIMGHWKKDGMCKTADLATYIKRRMAELDRDDKEDESSGILIWNFEHYSGSVGQLYACKKENFAGIGTVQYLIGQSV
jgi:hypothetical protein